MTAARDDIIDFMERQVAFNRLLGLRISELREGFVRMELAFKPDFVGDPHRPALHGGVMSAMLDTCGGAAVWSAVDPGDRVSTVDLRVDYLRPGPLEDLVCEARVLRLGNRVGVTEMQVFTSAEPERIIASGKGVYNIRRAE